MATWCLWLAGLLLCGALLLSLAILPTPRSPIGALRIQRDATVRSIPSTRHVRGGCEADYLSRSRGGDPQPRRTLARHRALLVGPPLAGETLAQPVLPSAMANPGIVGERLTIQGSSFDASAPGRNLITFRGSRSCDGPVRRNPFPVSYPVGGRLKAHD